MTRHRAVQLVALVVAAACLVGAAMVTRVVEDQRQELQLSGSIDIKEKLPPQVAVATAALGSFRGLAVDVMWYRLEMLKRDGKFHEANTLSQWITTLQPRFPQVWSFMAWNMAYNISVATYTPDERLDWVNKGIDLLRDKGIPFNPHAIRLYRELGWIFFHKVGQYSDDQHWYYKRRLAQEWAEVLGSEVEGGTTEQVIDAFRPVAEAYDLYVNQQRPTRAALAELDALIAANPAQAPALEELRELALLAFQRRLNRLHEQWRRESPTMGARLDRLAVMIDEQVARGAYSPLQLLARNDAEAAQIVDRLIVLGLPPGEDALRQLGRMRMVLDSADARTFGVLDAQPEGDLERELMALFRDDATRDAMTRAIAFYRASVLSVRYSMDPNWMLHLMAKYGPIDWRNPAAHSLYWSSMGVRMAEVLRNKKDIDLLNTIRQVIHSLQTLMFYGRTTYDPVSGYIDQIPDPRFIPAYETAVLEGGEEVQKAEWGGGTADSFDAGYENFLIKAVMYTYLYGDEQQARDYYRKLRERFGDKDHNVRSGRYLLPMDQFVTREMREDIGMMQVTRQAIDAFLRTGIEQGLANNRLDVYERRRAIAKVLHDEFQKKAVVNPTAPQDRMRLLPFEQLEAETFIAYMQDERMPLLVRVRVWRNTPIALRQATYERLRPDLMRQTQAAGADMDRAFPAPPGAAPRPLGPSTDDAARDAAQPMPGIGVERQ